MRALFRQSYDIQNTIKMVISRVAFCKVFGGILNIVDESHEIW